MTARRRSNAQETAHPTLCTIRGVCEDKVLELRPLCGQPADELEGVHWVTQETLGVSSGGRREDVQSVCPPAGRCEEFNASTFTRRLH